MQKIQAKKSHCKYCFDVLIAKLTGKNIPKFPQNQLDSETPIFVTWKKNGQLRGCIGTFSPSKLSNILSEYAIISSMKDSRFPPIQMKQLKQLSVGVSLLINFQQNKSLYDWQIQKHGIVIKASLNGKNYSGTFLPQVAHQQNWDQKQTVQYLLRKAGYYGKLEQIESSIILTTYESSKQSMDYTEYLKQTENK